MPLTSRDPNTRLTQLRCRIQSETVRYHILRMLSGKICRLIFVSVLWDFPSSPHSQGRFFRGEESKLLITTRPSRSYSTTGQVCPGIVFILSICVTPYVRYAIRVCLSNDRPVPIKTEFLLAGYRVTLVASLCQRQHTYIQQIYEIVSYYACTIRLDWKYRKAILVCFEVSAMLCHCQSAGLRPPVRQA